MKLSSLVYFFCCLPVLLMAGDGYRFRYIDLPEAMRDATISGATTDRAGMLWFYSSSGLHRYDGNQLLTFNQVSKPAIASNFITGIFADSRDRIWIGTQSGLIRFDLRSWVTQTISPSGSNSLNVTEICESRDGDIYLATNDGELMRVEGDRLVTVADLGKAFPSGPTRASINYLQEALPGEFWVISNKRLLRIDKKGQTYDPGLPGDIITPVHFYSPHEVIFTSAGKGMYRYDVRSRQTERLPAPFNDTLNDGKRQFLFALPGGEVGFFVNKRGFFTYDPSTRQVVERMKGVDVDFSGIRAANMKSRGGKVYVSLNKSVAELQQIQTPFSNLLVNPSSEMVANSVRSILKHPNGLLYASTYSNGFISINENTGEKKLLGSYFVYSSLLWSPQKMLLSTEGDGLRWFHVAENRFERIVGDTLHTRPEDRMQDFFYTTLTRENDSLVWVGGYSGVFLLNPYTGRTAYIRQGEGWEQLRRAKVYGILKAGDRRYFATNGGLFAWYPEKKRLQRLTKEPMYDVQQFGNELWVGTNGKGVLIMDGNGRLIRQLNTQNGLAGDAVYFMLRQGNEVAAGTDRGLSIIRLQTREVSNYTRLQNLPSNEFNHSAAHAAGGRLYLGTINGITTFSMEELAQFRQERISIPLHFTGFSFSTDKQGGAQHMYNLPYLKENRLEVSAGVKYFSLRFGGVDAAADQAYYYRTNQDAPWLEIGRQREISFAGMAPGAYDVQLAAKLNDSKDFTTLLTLPVWVRPAWYQTIWFKVFCMLAVLLCTWLLFRYRMQQMLREQRLRTKIAGDLHDEVGSSLTRIYFQADHLSMQHTEKAALQKIADSSKHALSTMSDMVWSIDARFDTAEDLVARMRDYLSNFQNDLDIKCVFELQGDVVRRPLSQAIRQNFFLIFKEAVNNAARYSCEPYMKVVLTFSRNITMQVTNRYNSENGKMKQYQGGRGIEQMQARAVRMKGTLTAEKTAGEFVLRLQVPA